MAEPEMNPMADFETSASTDLLDAALAAAQGEILVAGKAKLNPHFKTNYADVTAIWVACRPALSKHGVSVSQWPVHSKDGRLHLITRVAHAGQWMKSRFSIPISKDDPQGYASAVTYIKRFALAAAVGVVAQDEDDDGAAASADKDAMPEHQLADHLLAIQGAETVNALKVAFSTAWKAAGNDKRAGSRFAAAKDARKKELDKGARA